MTDQAHDAIAPSDALGQDSLLVRPNPRFSAFGESPRQSTIGSGTPDPNNSTALLGDGQSAGTQRSSLVNEDAAKVETDAGLANGRGALGYNIPPKRSRSRAFWITIGLIVFLVVAIAVVLPTVLTHVLKHKNSSSLAGGSGSGGGGGGDGNNPESPTGATTGGNGSIITTADGTTFTYINNFGGFWIDDPNDPFNDGAQPNSWTPPLNQTWQWGVDKIYGVNLGGWFVLEPFIVPSLFEKYQNLSFPVIDEWTLSQAMANDTSPGGGLSQLEEHYNTFITEQDIAEIAAAGLNWIRLPIPFWAIDTWPGEPFLPKVCWKYILRFLQWARKYGIRVNLDLHTIPGSQNGFNHSGKDGLVGFLNGVMGYANAQRTLGYIRIITEFISQPEYKNVVQMFGIINEPLVGEIGMDTISRFYLQAYDMIRDITGVGSGNGAMISMHDGFSGLGAWAGFMAGADRMVLDTHPYIAFNGQPNTQPVDFWPPQACIGFGPTMNESQTAFGPTYAGEWSNGINDCGLFLHGVGGTPSYGGNCSFWQDATQWNETVIDGLKSFSLASMDALQNWFFWTWKIGNSSATNTVQSPLWSYQLGLQGGWIPTDPRTHVGTCLSLNGPQIPFNESYQSWQTGGAGAGTISASILTSLSQWPPPSIANLNPGADVSFLPTYASTGVVDTLPPISLTAVEGKHTSTISAGDGWADASDTGGGVTVVAGCSYLDPWNAVAGVTAPTTLCPAATAAAKRGTQAPVNVPMITPPPEAKF